jgi:hypothetical protein
MKSSARPDLRAVARGSLPIEEVPFASRPIQGVSTGRRISLLVGIAFLSINYIYQNILIVSPDFALTAHVSVIGISAKRTPYFTQNKGVEEDGKQENCCFRLLLHQPVLRVGQPRRHFVQSVAAKRSASVRNQAADWLIQDISPRCNVYGFRNREPSGWPNATRIGHANPRGRK